MRLIEVRNVNDAIDQLMRMLRLENGDRWVRWLPRDVRGSNTLEWHEPVVTIYEKPEERVSFSTARDANPFFHLFESIWILAGRQDVAFLKLFNSRIDTYSDDGLVFHAPYGYRLRKHFVRRCIVNSHDRFPNYETRHLDQLEEVIELLRKDPHTRRAVLSIWSPALDLNVASNDIPCNDLLMFKVRDGKLDLTVCCRSNDVIWGAYGANAVQFSMIHEFVARATGLENSGTPVGVYRQLSDSYHVYPHVDAYLRMMAGHDYGCDPYATKEVSAIPLFDHPDQHTQFTDNCRFICDLLTGDYEISDRAQLCPFFDYVVVPMWKAWCLYKKESVQASVDLLQETIDSMPRPANDWLEAGARWMTRRIKIR